MNRMPYFEEPVRDRPRGTSPAAIIAFVLLFTLLLAVANAGRVSAQALHPDVRLNRPTTQSANRLDALRSSVARIALYDASASANQASAGATVTVRDAVYFWDLFLLGLNVPYRTIDERDLTGGISDDIRVLILPSAEVLSERQQRNLLRFVERGGGLIASGQVGFLDEKGRPLGDAFFRRLFGAEMVMNLPEQPSGLLQSVSGGNPLTDGLPPGFRLNLTTPKPLSAARPVTAVAVGRPFTYSAIHRDDPFDAVSFIVYNRLGRGRSVWFRFNPQDVSREAPQQQVYQALVVNAMAFASAAPSVAVRPWPDTYLSATVFANLPGIGPTPDFSASVGRVVDALSAAGAKATFFFTTAEARLQPGVVSRVSQQGEVAISADTYDVLKNGSLDVQERRLSTALADLRPLSSGSISGLYPPGGFYDVATVRAMHSAGFEYMLLPGVGESDAPHPLRWYGDADYREPLALSENAVDAAALATTQPKRITRNGLVAFSSTGRNDYTVTTVLGLASDPAGQTRVYQEDFMRVHGGRGLYVLPFHLGIQGRTAERAAVLGQVAELAVRQGSWVTTFRDVLNWYKQHQQLSLQIIDATERSLTVDLVNAGSTSVSRVSLDVRLPRPAKAANASDSMKLLLSSDGETVMVTVPAARPGSTRFTISYDTR